jgi:hypothetical protein
MVGPGFSFHGLIYEKKAVHIIVTYRFLSVESVPQNA